MKIIKYIKMTSNIKLAFIALLFISLNSCKDNAKSETENTSETTEETTAIPDMHTSESSLDWDGTYKGTLPCADCEGIETTLTLNTDKTYTKQSIYLGKEDATFETKGTFSWNEDGSVITLSEEDSGTGMYKVGENQIWHLDRSGNQVTGDLAAHYILTKS